MIKGGIVDRSVVLINSNRMKPPVAPIALDYLAPSLEEKGYRVEILDLCFINDYYPLIEEFFRQHSVEAVGITIRNTDDCYYLSQDFFLPQIKLLIQHIRSFTKGAIILGGTGFSLLPIPILNYCGGDFGIYGDGEIALPLLLESLYHHRDYSRIPNLVYRSRQKWIANAPYYFSLDRLPLPSRQAVDNRRYYREGGMGNIETKRGCSQKCIYCADPIARGKKIRCRSPHKVVEEIEKLLSLGIEYFHLCDSEFNLPEEHALLICEEIVRQGLGNKIHWYTYASPVPFSRRLARLMKEAGCTGIDFGVDSGNDHILRNLGRNFCGEDIKNTALLCQEYELVFMYDLLLGGPGETKDTIKETIYLMKEINPHRVGISTGIRIYPGTRLSGILGEEGVTSRNPALHGKVENNPHFLAPIFYISPEVGKDISYLVRELVGNDKRFFLASPEDGDQNYNYNENIILVEAIKRGYRGAYWDILRRISENRP